MTETDNAGRTRRTAGATRDADSSSSRRPASSEEIARAAELESLASRFSPEQHATYLRHLEEAVANPRNLNIALTGRYGTGKSSVLDKFEEESKGRPLRISISTLSPDAEDTTLTNRIQKEFVKQLLYRAAPRDLRFSRFNRIVALSRQRAAIQALATIGVVGGILTLLGWLPAITGSSAGHPWPERTAAWVLFAGLVGALLTALQLVVHGRFIVSNVSAAGAAITLAQRTSTYFDEYLDEIVYFFDETSFDTVIFEDLDRFDDPHIFEALRELNTLLNQTARRRDGNEPLRFVYAIKDSMFERLGSDVLEVDDAAVAETIRANRTKFFDIIIPMVPFISHRNARELLAGILQDRGFTDVERALIALVAQYATDMRLLKNICNEYAVFSERLIGSARTAPDLTASNLFALVTYKNFHPHDFEEMTRHNSDLDTLYEQHRALVRTAIEGLEERKRDILAHPERYRAMQALAERYGEVLIAFGTAVKAQSNPSWPLVFQLTDQPGDQPQDAAKTYDFWAAVAKAGQLPILARQVNSGRQLLCVLNASQIKALFPDVFEAGEWLAIDEERNAQSVRQIEADVAFLRSADFDDLAGRSTFTLPTDEGPRDFASLIDTGIKSQLGRELVKRGYLNRNFALYAAQFYGDFSGIDVANFIVQSAQPNRMDIDYTFKSPGAIANLLTEVSPDFPLTVSAYNIEILDYLLEREDNRAAVIVGTMVTRPGQEARDFRGAYLNSGSARAPFAQLLSSLPWPTVLAFLAEDPGVPADVRSALFDAALRGLLPAAAYTLGAAVRDFIVANYLHMSVFTVPQDPRTHDTIIALIKEAGVILPVLAGVDGGLRERVVRDDLYALTADNLREALGVTGNTSLDRVSEKAEVYDRCLKYLSEYLAAIASDLETPYSVLSEAVLVRVLHDAENLWEAEVVGELISAAAPECRIDDLGRAPAACWPALAEHDLFRPTVRNIRMYCDTAGTIDRSLASLLDRVESLDTDGAGDEMQESVAIDILNAADVIPNAGRRVDLVVRMDLAEHLPPEKIAPKAGELLALLLTERIVEDSYESFAHFASAGWQPIEPAIAKSSKFAEFMKPGLVDGFVGELLDSSEVPSGVKDLVVDHLADYLPDEKAAPLAAAGRHALTQGRRLPVDQLQRIAAATADPDLAMSLLAAASPLQPASDVVLVLASLGGPYSNLNNATRAEFDVPNTPAYRSVFEHLKDAGLVAEFKKRRLQELCIVKPTAL